MSEDAYKSSMYHLAIFISFFVCIARLNIDFKPVLSPTSTPFRVFLGGSYLFRKFLLLEVFCRDTGLLLFFEMGIAYWWAFTELRFEFGSGCSMARLDLLLERLRFLGESAELLSEIFFICCCSLERDLMASLFISLGLSVGGGFTVIFVCFCGFWMCW